MSQQMSAIRPLETSAGFSSAGFHGPDLPFVGGGMLDRSVTELAIRT